MWALMSCDVVMMLSLAGVFGDKWQKRYVVLDGCNLRYYKKMGVSEGFV